MEMTLNVKIDKNRKNQKQELVAILNNMANLVNGNFVDIDQPVVDLSQGEVGRVKLKIK